jgi:putative membrane protein
MNMAVDVKIIAEINLVVQLLLTLALIGAVYLAKNKKFGSHCKVMRMAVPVQILAILAVMLPSMNGYLVHGTPGPLFQAEMLAHHFIGLTIVLLWVYINLVFLKYLRPRFKIRTAMRLALAFWALSLVMGLHMFASVYA